MGHTLSCPACNTANLDVCQYDSMMVVRADTALFTLRCPVCNTVVSSIQSIPASLREEVQFAAQEVGAGMGKD